MAPNTDIATRALIVTLKSPCGGRSTADIYAITGVRPRTINDIYARAISRGFDPNQYPLSLHDSHLEDAPRSGRPSKKTAEAIDNVVQAVRTDRYGREKTCAYLAYEISQQGAQISAMTVWRILKSAGFRKTKPTRKPGLTQTMKDQRLAWCLKHENWTIEEWKQVIFSDETSVVLGHRRGGYRVWRTADERYNKSCIRPRWKGYSEFMFWGCFSYDKKGPCHVWSPETKQEKDAAKKAIDLLNKELEPLAKQEWELTNGIRRLGLRNRPGPKPQWRWDIDHGKLTREGGGGIDWWRYQSKVLIPKLIPFAIELGPSTIVQEDKAPAHSHHYQQRVFDIYKVQRMIWCGNSPDLNAIEPCWFYMKRQTTKKGAPQSRAEGIKAWNDCWKELPQQQIQAWIERIPRHIKQIIALKGGNEYHEGREHIRRLHQAQQAPEPSE